MICDNRYNKYPPAAEVHPKVRRFWRCISCGWIFIVKNLAHVLNCPHNLVAFGNDIDYASFSLLENLASEQNDVHHSEEENKNDECENRFRGSQRRKEHHREAEDDGGKILIDHIIRGGCFEILINLAKKDSSRACGAREHAVHHEKLLLFIVGKENFGNDTVIDESDDKARRAEDKNNAPIVFEDIETDRCDACHYHHVEEKVAGAGHEEVIGVFLADDLYFSEKVDCEFDERCGKNTDEEVEAVDHRAHTGQEVAETKHDEIREEVCYDDERDLDGHLINAFLHGNLSECFHTL